MESVHPLVQEYEQAILGFQPRAYAKMNERGAAHKYIKVYRRLTLQLLGAHLRGDMTLATCLINSAGSARAAVLDIDEGGEEALRKVLYTAWGRGVSAFAQSSLGDEHSGGHVWLLFDGWGEPARLRLLADKIAQESETHAETYPTLKSIRLPLGVHRWTGKRGRLIFQDASFLELDEGEALVKTAIRRIASLSRNSINQLPTLPPPEQRPLRGSERQSKVEEGQQNVILDYNHSTDLIALLERAGGRIAQPLRNGGVLMHCPCPHHKHHDARPSIEVRPAKNTQRYGDFVVYGYSPDCVFYTERGHITDAFSAYCKLNYLDPKDAVKELSK